MCCAGLLSEGRLEPGPVPGRPGVQQPPLGSGSSALSPLDFEFSFCFFGSGGQGLAGGVLIMFKGSGINSGL